MAACSRNAQVENPMKEENVDIKQRKPKLSPVQQVERMEGSGIAFEVVGKEEAVRFLEDHCNYFKMASYRKLYPKSRNGRGEEKYIGLDFGHLIDLYEVDRALQRTLLSMTLDVEMAARVKLLRRIDTSDEDGYGIVSDYFASLPDPIRRRRQDSIARKRNDPYCGEAVSKYLGRMPVWVLFESLTFGDFNSFYMFCSARWGDRRMEREHYYLKRAKSVRNAAAHGLCIMNGFARGKGPAPRTPPEVSNALSEYGLGERARKRNLSIERLQQIAVLCYAYRTMVEEDSRYSGTLDAIDAFKRRMRLHGSYFDKNTSIVSSFDFLDQVLTFAVTAP